MQMIDRTSTNTIYEKNKIESLSVRNPTCIFNTMLVAKELDTTQWQGKSTVQECLLLGMRSKQIQHRR